MNGYGMLAMRHWEQFAPGRVATMVDREGFFTDLGAQVETQVVELTQRLQVATPTNGETYPEAVGRLNNARMRARTSTKSGLRGSDLG